MDFSNQTGMSVGPDTEIIIRLIKDTRFYGFHTHITDPNKNGM